MNSTAAKATAKRNPSESTFLRGHLTSSLVAGIAMFSLVMTAKSFAGSGAGGPGAHYTPPKEGPKLQPAQIYSGQSPIDLSNGIFFNNGTFGAPNPEYEAYKAEPHWAVGLIDRTYGFSEKAKFAKILNERIQFHEHAVWNWGRVSERTKPEVIEYAKAISGEIQPLIDRARSALKQAESASEKGWLEAQAEAKQAYIALQAFYREKHIARAVSLAK